MKVTSSRQHIIAKEACEQDHRSWPYIEKPVGFQGHDNIQAGPQHVRDGYKLCTCLVYMNVGRFRARR